MEKKENERDISDLLTRLRESVNQSEQTAPSAADMSDRKQQESTFDRELSDRLEKHLQAEEGVRTEQSQEDELTFDVAELEIVADGTLDPDRAEAAVAEDGEEELLPDLEALMARMTPEQRARFEQEMLAAEAEETDTYPEEDLGVSEPEEDEYELPEIEAFRAMEARMTPEQRARWEEALREAEEEEVETPPIEQIPEEEETEDDGVWVFGDLSVQDAIDHAVSSEPSVVEMKDEPMVVSPEEEQQETLSEEAFALQASEAEAPSEMLTVTTEGNDPVMTDEARGIVVSEELSEAEPPEDAPVFFTVESDAEMEDMPAIKVGMDPSAFSLAEESSEESEDAPEDEEEALAALLARMSPEQLVRFREVMMQDEEEGESGVSREDEAPHVAVAAEEMAEDGESEATPQEIEEEPEVVSTSATEVESSVESAEEVPQEADAAESADPETDSDEDVQDSNPLAAILDNPEMLEALMARLTPEQAAELERALQGDGEDVVEEELAQAEEDSDGDVTPTESENGEDASEKIPLNDILEEQNAKLQTAETADDAVVEIGEQTELPDKASESLEEPEEDEEDTPLIEISEDMTDEEVSLMLALGCEKELIHTLGKERVEQVKKRVAREEARDPEFADAYAYEGQEYRHREQADRIRDRYGKEKRKIWFRLGGTALFALLLFLYECCGVFRGAFGGVLDPAHYPVIAIMTGWQLLVFASAFSWKQLLHGIRSAFVLEPDNHAMTAVAVAVVMFNNILMAIVFKGSSLYLYNFPAVLCLLCSVLCDLADVCREELTFDVISSPAAKYVAEAVTLSEGSADMPPPEEETEASRTQLQKNAVYVRRVGFVKNYFRRTNRKTSDRQVLNFVFLPLLAFAIVMGIMTALTGNGTAPALSVFAVSVLLCMPMSYTVLHSLPQYCEARRLHKQGCAIVGESAVEEYNRYPTVVFEDKELFPPILIKTKGLKLYENNMIYSVILKISLLFREIGGPINEVLDLDKEEMKRFLASGRAGALADGKVMLERMSEEGMIAGLSDGSRVVAGSVAFLQAHGVFVRPNAKDQQLLQLGDMSILYLAFDGKLSARFYVDYQPDPEFETLTGMLHEDEFRVAVRTLDPGINDDMIAHKCLEDTPAIHTVRVTVGELTERPSSEAKVDSGLVCQDDPRKMLLPLRAVRNLRRLHRFGLRLYAIALFVNVLVTIILTAFSAAGYMSSLFVSLYMLVWLATSLVLTKLFLNK